MSYLLIPTRVGLPDYSMRTSLDGRDFNLRFVWNMREERWYMDIRTDIDEPLALGVKIVSNWPLLRGAEFDLRLPQGMFVAIDATNDGSPPGLYDFGIGKRVELSYSPVAVP